MSDFFWPSDAQMACLEPCFPTSLGKPSVDAGQVRSWVVFINHNALHRRSRSGRWTGEDAIQPLQAAARPRYLCGVMGEDSGRSEPCRGRAGQASDDRQRRDPGVKRGIGSGHWALARGIDHEYWGAGGRGRRSVAQIPRTARSERRDSVKVRPKAQRYCDKEICKPPRLVENRVAKIKEFRGIATSYDKTGAAVPLSGTSQQH